jgi:hypothetical protein
MRTNVRDRRTIPVCASFFERETGVNVDVMSHIGEGLQRRRERVAGALRDGLPCVEVHAVGHEDERETHWGRRTRGGAKSRDRSTPGQTHRFKPRQRHGHAEAAQNRPSGDRVIHGVGLRFRNERNESLRTMDSMRAGNRSPCARVRAAIRRIARRSNGSVPRPSAYTSTFAVMASTT